MEKGEKTAYVSEKGEKNRQMDVVRTRDGTKDGTKQIMKVR